MPCVWPLNPQLLQATKPLLGGYVIKMARKRFVTEIFSRRGNRLSKLCKYVKHLATELAQT
jgi:hypothetical protein